MDSEAPAPKRQALGPTIGSACKDEAQALEAIAALRRGGGEVSGKLARKIGVFGAPGLVATENLAEGELVLEVPGRLHLVPRNLESYMPRLVEACQKLPTSSEDRRNEAAQALAMSLLLGFGREDGGTGSALRKVYPDVPDLWLRASTLLASFVGPELLECHPYGVLRRPAGWPDLSAALKPSCEASHIQAQASYVSTVFKCITDCVPSELLCARFDEELFLEGWLCMLSRKFTSPEGSAYVPVVDLLNHSSDPSASCDWDDDTGSVVVRTKRPHQAGEEILICYGELSNPLLFRTYGFSIPAQVEPCSSCTFEEEELVQVLSHDLAVSGEPLNSLKDLPNLHLETSRVTAELATLLQEATLLDLDASKLLFSLCTRRLSLYADRDDGLPPTIAAEMSVQADRIRQSEQKCLEAHLNVLTALGVKDFDPSSFDASLADLASDFRVIKEAGLLGSGQGLAEDGSAAGPGRGGAA